jgi:SulP family sulfate permease
LTELSAVTDVRVVILRLPQPEHLKVLAVVGALDRLAHENHLFVDLDAAVAHAHSHVARMPVG